MLQTRHFVYILLKLGFFFTITYAMDIFHFDMTTENSPTEVVLESQRIYRDIKRYDDNIDSFSQQQQQHHHQHQQQYDSKYQNNGYDNNYSSKEMLPIQHYLSALQKGHQQLNQFQYPTATIRIVNHPLQRPKYYGTTTEMNKIKKQKNCRNVSCKLDCMRKINGKCMISETNCLCKS